MKKLRLVCKDGTTSTCGLVDVETGEYLNIPITRIKFEVDGGFREMGLHAKVEVMLEGVDVPAQIVSEFRRNLPSLPEPPEGTFRKRTVIPGAAYNFDYEFQRFITFDGEAPTIPIDLLPEEAQGPAVDAGIACGLRGPKGRFEITVDFTPEEP